MNFSALIMALVGPAAKQVLSALGIGIVTFAGVGAALDAIIGYAQGAYGEIVGLPATFLAMGGVNTAVSMIVGALVARLALTQLKRLMPV